jgi:hypothetical protein
VAIVKALFIGVLIGTIPCGGIPTDEWH